MHVDLKPGQPGFGKLVPCPECQKRDLVAERGLRLAQSRLNLMEQNWTLEKIWTGKPGRARGKAAALTVLDHNGWLTLYGGYGSGKSYLGCAIVNAGLERGLRSTYWLMPLFLEELRKAFDPAAGETSSELYDRALNADVLVIDEFEKFYPTPWASERFQTLFLQRGRMYQDAVTVWITNLDPTVPAQGPAELDALYSRMRHHTIIHMDDGDIRPTLGAARAAEGAR